MGDIDLSYVRRCRRMRRMYGDDDFGICIVILVVSFLWKGCSLARDWQL